MKPNVTPEAFRRAVYPILGLSWFVLLGFYNPKGALEFIASCPIQISVGCAVMILVIEFVGVPQRARLYHFGAGMLFAFFLFIAGIVSGFSSSMLVDGVFNLKRYVLQPLYFFSFWGVLPAAIFGLIGTAILRSTSKAARPTTLHLKRP